MGNQQVINLTQMILGYAIHIARRDSAMHTRYMRMVHKLLMLSFLPRMLAPFIRWLFPISSIDGTSAFSVACALNWWLQLNSMRRLKNEKVRGKMTTMNVISVLLSLAILMSQWIVGFNPLVVGILGPIV